MKEIKLLEEKPREMTVVVEKIRLREVKEDNQLYWK
jgi:hypothetical protein